MVQPYLPTTIEDWTRSDHYHNSFLIHQDDDLEKALENNNKHNLPNIAISPSQGKFLKLIALSIGARRILEVGTLGGYSTIWLGQALPEDGEMITAELLPAHAETARENIEKAGLSSKIKVIVGPAAETLANLNPSRPFDLVFIDADKHLNPTYFKEAKRLVREGGVIIVDNVVQHGRVSDPSYSDDDVEGVRALLSAISVDKEVDAVTIGTAGEKGQDGFLYAIRH